MGVVTIRRMPSRYDYFWVTGVRSMCTDAYFVIILMLIYTDYASGSWGALQA